MQLIMERYNNRLLLTKHRYKLIMLMVFGNHNNHKRRRYRLIRKLPRLRGFEHLLFNRILTEHLTLFNCPKCRLILTSPITLVCGHTFCYNCLNLNKNLMNCWVCGVETTTIPTITNNSQNNHSSNPCVNVLVQDLVEKWREQKTGNLQVNTINILRIQPRYHLRSGFAGLQLSDITNISASLNNFKCNNRIVECKTIRMDTVNAQDFECILCSRFLLDPVTTICGHTFCRDCLIRVLDHGLSCPLCMQTLTTKDYSRATTFLLDQASKYLFVDDYKNRLNLHYKEIETLNRNSELPVFVCTNAFPGVACPLYVYEPRYRLLVRRCLQSSSRRFAMAAKESSGDKFACSGTILEIRDAVSLEDGSFILTTVGVRRFKVISTDEQDGYDTAKIEFIRDSPVSTEKLPDLIALHQKVYNKASKWIRSLTPKVLDEVERLIGRMPTVERNWLSLPDGPAWTWWLMPILPLSSQLQLGFLNSIYLEKRLRAIDKMLERMEIRMKALERNCSSEQHQQQQQQDDDATSESCGDPDRTIQMSLTTN